MDEKKKNHLLPPEGRKVEYKSELPKKSDRVKTIIAFANDAGGDLYIGVSDTREIVGVNEDELTKIEETISSIIYDCCHPKISYEIKTIRMEDKPLIQVTVFEGTFMRFGSTTRVADEETILQLKRKKRNISFDSEIVFNVPSAKLNIDSFKALFKDKAKEELNEQTLRKLNLVKESNGIEYPTNALVLLSDDELHNSMFPYAKIECARFKGIKGKNKGEFIDKKSIHGNIALQAEEAYDFILRHINRGATVEGVYTIDSWEYPISAIREIIRNAVVHRDYSSTGADIKVAIYDNMIEIISPGRVPSSIDFDHMEEGQSDIRNKIIAPTFKRMGIIDQWGNGLKIVADELKLYEKSIKLEWKEVGSSLYIRFVNIDFINMQKLQELQELQTIQTIQELHQKLRQESPQESQQELQLKFPQGLPQELQQEMQQRVQKLQQEIPQELQQVLQQRLSQRLPQMLQKFPQEVQQVFQKLPQELQQELQQEMERRLPQKLQQELRLKLQQESDNPSLYSAILQQLSEAAMSRKDISLSLGQKEASGQLHVVLKTLMQNKLIEHIFPTSPNHPHQKFKLTDIGRIFLRVLNNSKS